MDGDTLAIYLLLLAYCFQYICACGLVPQTGGVVVFLRQTLSMPLHYYQGLSGFEQPLAYRSSSPVLL